MPTKELRRRLVRALYHLHPLALAQNPERAGTEGKQQQGAGDQGCRFGNRGHRSDDVSTRDGLFIVTVTTKEAAVENGAVH